MSDDDHSHRHRRRHEHKHKTKFSEDTPEDAQEKKEISSRVGGGLLSDKEALYGAPTAPSGTYVGEVFDTNGNVIRFIGAKVPLYITPDVLDFEFVEYLRGNASALAEVTSRGKPPSNEDKIVIMSSTVAGRTRLANYKNPSELFAVDSGARPMLVRDYYLEPAGLAGQTRGIRPSVTKPLGSALSVSSSTFIGALTSAIRGTPAAPAAAPAVSTEVQTG